MKLGVDIAERVTSALRHVFSKSRMMCFMENPEVSDNARKNAETLLDDWNENPFRKAEDLAKKEQLKIEIFIETNPSKVIHFANCGELASACVHEFPENCHLYRCKLIGDLPNKGEIQHIVLMYTLGDKQTPNKMVIFDPWSEVLLPTEDYFKYVTEKTGVKIKSLTAIKRDQNKSAIYKFDEDNHIIDGDVSVINKWAKDAIVTYRQAHQARKALIKQNVNQSAEQNQTSGTEKRNTLPFLASVRFKKPQGYD